MVKVGVIGASGYGGIELLRILSQHPAAQVSYVAGNHDATADLSEEYSFLRQFRGLRLQKYDQEACLEGCDSVFVALPSGVSGNIAAELWRHGKQVIDLSGDLRLPANLYEEWYQKPPVAQDALGAAVYGLTEWHREAVRHANLIANPGCFASAILLALLPAVKSGALMPGASIYIDAKSGVSGAGRGVNTSRQLAELADNFYPYRIAKHQHTPEVELNLSADGEVRVLITTQLLPIPRGILASCYVPLQDGFHEAEILAVYQNQYEDDPFIHVLPSGQVPQLKHVRGSNETHISVHVDERTRTLQVFSVLDNLQKGAAGQAVQNWNLMNGWPETTALTVPALYP